MTTSQDAIRRQLTETCSEVRRHVQEFPWEDARRYALWLAQTHAYVCHTPRVAALAAARLPYGRETLRAAMLRHALAEIGHERLLESDLRALGVSRGDLPILHDTISFYQSMYYQIEYESPLSVAGRGLVLELVGAESHDIHRRVVAAHGGTAATFLRVHAEADSEHVETSLRSLADLDANDVRAVVTSMILTGGLYRTVLAAIPAAPRFAEGAR